jgi:branched-chain amino acid aminotransferase
VAGKVYIDGQLVAPESATISILDRGFLYGDSVYEVLRVYSKIPFALAEHLERLYASGARIGFELPWRVDQIREAARVTLEAAGLADAYLRIIATRGAGPISLDPQAAVDPKLIILALPLPALPPEIYSQGRSAWLVSVRRNLKRAIDPQAKTGNYMNSVLAAGEARAHGADEAIMLDSQGRVAEGSSANVFAHLDGTWVTPPLEIGILSGITRRILLTAGEQAGQPVAQRPIWPEELCRADEVFLCSSVRELVPIVRLQGDPVGKGQVGDKTRRMHALYRERVRAATARS